MDARWQRFAVIATVTVVSLLVASNVLLLQLVLEDDGASAPTAEPAAQGKLPALPQPSSKNGSSKALLKELNKTQRRFEQPLDQALMQLDSVSNSAATLDQLPVLLQEMVASTSSLESVAPELKQLDKRLRSLNRQIDRMSKFALGLSPVLVDLETTMRTMRDDLARIRECTEKPSTCQ